MRTWDLTLGRAERVEMDRNRVRRSVRTLGSLRTWVEGFIVHKQGGRELDA